MDTRNTTKRRDPLTEVVDIDSLKAASRLAAELTPEREAAWAANPVQEAPDARAPFERTRQVLTFLLPVTLFACLVFLLPQHPVFPILKELVTTLLQTSPTAVDVGYAVFVTVLAFGLGALLDMNLQRDIRAARDRMSFEFKRYRVTRELAERLNLALAEITLERVKKMARDYPQVEAHLKAYFEARHSDATIREAAREANERYRRRSQGGAAAAGAAAAGAYSVDADTGEIFNYDHYGPTVNPASGLPMMGNNAPLDVAGNVFGTGGFDNNGF